MMYVEKKSRLARKNGKCHRHEEAQPQTDAFERTSARGVESSFGLRGHGRISIVVIMVFLELLGLKQCPVKSVLPNQLVGCAELNQLSPGQNSDALTELQS